MAKLAPSYCGLVASMFPKIPVRSVRYFLDVSAHCVFDAVRRSGHPSADTVVAYLYDVLLTQQKTAVSLHEYLRLTAFAQENKGEAVVLRAEIEAIREADSVITYLKATIEKTLILVGLIYQICGIESKKSHSKRIKALEEGLPAHLIDTDVKTMLLGLVDVEKLQSLNTLRTGLMHRSGVGDLQPHSYTMVNADSRAFGKVFSILKQQHLNNTKMLLVSLKLLSDELCRLDPTSLRAPIGGEGGVQATVYAPGET